MAPCLLCHIYKYVKNERLLREDSGGSLRALLCSHTSLPAHSHPTCAMIRPEDTAQWRALRAERHSAHASHSSSSASDGVDGSIPAPPPPPLGRCTSSSSDRDIRGGLFGASDSDSDCVDAAPRTTARVPTNSPRTQAARAVASPQFAAPPLGRRASFSSSDGLGGLFGASNSDSDCVDAAPRTTPRVQVMRAVASPQFAAPPLGRRASFSSSDGGLGGGLFGSSDSDSDYVDAAPRTTTRVQVMRAVASPRFAAPQRVDVVCDMPDMASEEEVEVDVEDVGAAPAASLRDRIGMGHAAGTLAHRRRVAAAGAIFRSAQLHQDHIDIASGVGIEETEAAAAASARAVVRMRLMGHAAGTPAHRRRVAAMLRREQRQRHRRRSGSGSGSSTSDSDSDASYPTSDEDASSSSAAPPRTGHASTSDSSDCTSSSSPAPASRLRSPRAVASPQTGYASERGLSVSSPRLRTPAAAPANVASPTTVEMPALLDMLSLSRQRSNVSVSPIAVPRVAPAVGTASGSAVASPAPSNTNQQAAGDALIWGGGGSQPDGASSPEPAGLRSNPADFEF